MTGEPGSAGDVDALCVILAAGRGERMRSNLPKVAHRVLGKPMIQRVVETAREAGLSRIVVVVGHAREALIPMLESMDVEWVVQEQQLGTADAVRVSLQGREASEVAVLLGDVPLLLPTTLRRLMEARTGRGAAASVLTARPEDPSGYGRVIEQDGLIRRIVEEREATAEQRRIDLINTGLMCFDGEVLPGLIDRIDNENSKSEFYLTDAISIASAGRLECISVEVSDWREAAGVNDHLQLAAATDFLRTGVIEALAGEGVMFVEPSTCWIEEDVQIGRDVTIGRFVRISGSSVVSDGAVIGDFCIVEDGLIGPGEHIEPYTLIRRGRGSGS